MNSKKYGYQCETIEEVIEWMLSECDKEKQENIASYFDTHYALVTMSGKQKASFVNYANNFTN